MHNDRTSSQIAYVAPPNSHSSQAQHDGETHPRNSAMGEKHIEEHNQIRSLDSSEVDEDQPYKEDMSLALSRPRTHTLGILKLRARDDTDPTDWWFASTAIPLIAATFAPMANLLSIAALVVPWRAIITTPDEPTTIYSAAKGYDDPKWCLCLNAASLACGFVGNLFLLFNFTKRVRYIVALPVTILFFYLASGILMAIIICMHKYQPPGADGVYSQGYWHAIIASCLYMLNSMILMVNMGGYFLGHYPQNFTLSDEHRNLILQTMLFFIWLGGGAAVFTRTEQDWSYPDALYFCDVTILTIGFGDYFAHEDLGRGLVFPYSVGGTIILGLMVSSIHKFAGELSKEKVIMKHVETRRVDTLSRAVTLEDLDDDRLQRMATGQRLSISRPSGKHLETFHQDLNELARQERSRRTGSSVDNAHNGVNVEYELSPNSERQPAQLQGRGFFQKSFRTLTIPIVKPVMTTTGNIRRAMTRKQKQILMLQERDRFNAMRSVQVHASTFKRYYALTISIICFGMLWCLGAMVFYFAEAKTQGLNYFQGLYFCYVSLLTIGYGDLSPRSSAGKAFFVVWSLIAVPAMTILISDLGDTVIGGFKRGVLKNDLGLTSKSQNKGSPSSWRSFLARLFRKQNQPVNSRRTSSSQQPARLEEARQSDASAGYDEKRLSVVNPEATIEDLASEDVSDAEMMQRLAFAIRQTADDLKTQPGKKYSYEEWVQFTRLIKFSQFDKDKLNSGEASAMKQVEYDEAIDGIVEWDWLAADSPMTSEHTESEWVLDRLCESLLRVFKKSDLVLGGLQSEKSAKQPASARETVDRARVITFDADPIETRRSNQVQAVQAPARRVSEDLSRSPDMISKMTRFFQGDDVDDDSPQWSKRAKAKMGMAQTTEEAEPRISRDRRGSSPTPGGVYRRNAPFSLKP